jgi:hypothetical protein
LGWIALAATLVVTPWSSYDPINVPKLAVIAAGGFLAFGALASNVGALLSPKYRVITIACAVFVADLLLVFVISGTNIAQEFFGTHGRATGLVAYISLCFLMIAAVVSSTSSVVSRFAWTLLSAGGLSIVYGFVQLVGADPINWVNQYSPVIGFLGNPNFQSSFVGLSGVLTVSMMLGNSVKVGLRLAYFAYIMTSLYVIKETDSQQGFLVFAGGAAVVGLIRIAKSNFRF